MDAFETAARVLSAAMNGALHTRIASLHPNMSQGDITWLLGYLVEKNLLERDSFEAYWTTVDGVKFLEIHFNMERILRAGRTLV